MKMDASYIIFSDNKQCINLSYFIYRLVLSVADGTSDFSNFGGNCIASVADENGRPIITSSLQGQ